jgi:hypothetical protein
MPTILRLFWHWLRFIVYEIFRTFDREVTEKSTTELCKFATISNIDKRIEPSYYGRKTIIWALLRHKMCIWIVDIIMVAIRVQVSTKLDRLKMISWRDNWICPFLGLLRCVGFLSWLLYYVIFLTTMHVDIHNTFIG